MAYDDGVLYIYTSTPDMVALDAATGMQLWKTTPKNDPGVMEWRRRSSQATWST
jgi:glucose dehydrogenase